MKQYYECHITMRGNPKEIKEKVDAIEWKFSQIDGDPVLGEGVKCYATQHFNSSKRTLTDVISIVKNRAHWLRGRKIEVLREKVELVVWDKRANDVLM